VKGFHGRILHVDVTEPRHWVEQLPDEIPLRYLGGRGLGSYLLQRELQPGINPLSPDNVLIVATGPASGTAVPGASRYGLFSRSPLTGAYADSTSGGRVAPQLSRTGYDAVIIHGASPSPIYVEISDRDVRFHSASDLWGMDTYEAEEEVLSRTAVPQAQAVVIGPAGENLVRIACVENNKWRSAGRTGMGAVLGSKRVKGLVFHGHTERPVADPPGLEAFVKAMREKGKASPSTANFYTYGTPMTVTVTNTRGTFPTRYWTAGSLPTWKNIGADYLVENFRVRPRACPGCFLACGKVSTVLKGRHKGLTIEGPEYETIYALGGLCAIDSLEEIAYLNDLCDRYGLDTMSAGNLAALIMEANERGLAKEQARRNERGRPGLPPLRYGDAEGVATLLRQIAFREGPGSVLANGIVPASKAWHLEDLAIHVKGLEPAGYDPRVMKGMGLAYATSPRGACHLRATFYKYEFAGMIPPEQVEGKAEMFIEVEDRMTIMDTLILCRFFRDLYTWDELQLLVGLTTGIVLDRPALRRIANDITSLTRCFNLREGFGRADDALPARLHDESVDGHTLTREELGLMLSDYYRLRGWDTEGRPTCMH